MKKQYRFYSSSQCIFSAFAGGKVVRIKFSVVYNGVSHFDTFKESEARAVRNSVYFKNGVIVETDPLEVKDPEDIVQEKQEKQPEAIAAWMTKPATHKKSSSSSKKAEEAKTEAPWLGSNAKSESSSENVSSVSEGGITIDSVTSYMEAKTYLKDVLHVKASEISTKDKTMEYCTLHGISFPNFNF